MTHPSIMTLLAHPDDAELWCGGVLAAAAQHARVSIAVPRHSDMRDPEAVTGAKTLGAELHQLDDLTFDTIFKMLINVRPEVVITHSLNDVHSEHRETATALLDSLPLAVIETGHPMRVYTCDSYNSLTLHGPVVANTIIDVTATWNIKMMALAAHKSQPIIDHFGPMAERMGRLWGSRIGTCYAEAFQPIPILGRLPAAQHL